MPVVGLDEEIRQNKIATEEDIEKFEKSTSDGSRRILEKEEIQLSQKKLETLSKIYDDVVLHDYGDDYHKTEEELEKENAFFQLYRKISGKKQKFNDIADYISATRNCLDFMYAVANRQHIYPREEFISLWAKGEIEIDGMYLPKYKGKDKKRINGKALAEYVLSDGDPYDFIKEEEAPIIDSEEMLNRQIAELFSVGEYRSIIEDSIKEMVNDAEDDFVDSDDPSTYVGKPIAVQLSRKDKRKIMEKNPGLSVTIKDTMRTSRLSENFTERMVYDMHEDDYDAIRKYDETYGFKSSSDIPVLKGSLMDGGDFQDAMDALDEWNWNNTRVESNGKWLSMDELNDSRIKELLEQHGFNIRVLWNERSKEKKLKAYLKSERKREEKLRRELIKVEGENKRRKKELRKMSDADIRKLTKKAKKRKKDDKNKRIKKKKKKQIDEILLGTVGSTQESFDKYEGDALDWTFDKIKSGN